MLKAFKLRPVARRAGVVDRGGPAEPVFDACCANMSMFAGVEAGACASWLQKSLRCGRVCEAAAAAAAADTRPGHRTTQVLPSRSSPAM